MNGIMFGPDAKHAALPALFAATSFCFNTLVCTVSFVILDLGAGDSVLNIIKREDS